MKSCDVSVDLDYELLELAHFWESPICYWKRVSEAACLFRNRTNAIPYFPYCRYLSLANSYALDIATLRCLCENLVNFPQLRTLCLPHCRLRSSGLMAVCAQNLKYTNHLSYLDLRGNFLATEGFIALAASLPNLPALRTLLLRQNAMTPEGLSHLLRAMEHTPKLEYLEIDFYHYVETDFARAWQELGPDSRACQQLRHLHLSGIHFNYEGMVSFGQALLRMPMLRAFSIRGLNWDSSYSPQFYRGVISQLKTLNSLTLHSAHMDVHHMMWLMDAVVQLPVLGELDLSYNHLDASHLLPMTSTCHKWNSSLQRLKLNHNNLGENAVKSLVAVCGQRLLELDVSHNRLRDAGVTNLLVGLAFSHLDTLNVNFNGMSRHATQMVHDLHFPHQKKRKSYGQLPPIPIPIPWMLAASISLMTTLGIVWFIRRG
jgi:hypothetical protein